MRAPFELCSLTLISFGLRIIHSLLFLVEDLKLHFYELII
jgi:hypothetical protein